MQGHFSCEQDKRSVERDDWRKTRKLVYAALFAALTCVMTMIVKIPVPATGGYVNLGDCVVLLAGWVLGPMYGGGRLGLALCWPTWSADTLCMHLVPL